MREKRLTTAWVIQLAVVALLFPSDVSAETAVHVAGPFVEHISPPVLCRGRSNRIELFGRELDGALDLWSSTPGVQLKARPHGTNDSQHASFDVDVPADAPLGLYGLRLATRSGLSNVHLFLIDELPVQVRTESSLMKVALPAAIHSTCRAATVDRYEIEVTSGQRITFEVVGNRLGKDYDPLVTIRDAQGRILAERDNDVGLFFDCRFQHSFTDGGVYYVDVHDARYAGDPTWHYVLRMGDFPVARVAVPSSVTPGKVSLVTLPQIPGAVVEVALPATTPAGWFYHEVRLTPQGLATWLPLHVDQREDHVESEPNDVRDVATVTTVPATLHGVLDTVGDHDWFRFELKKGQAITVHSEARALGSPADLEMVLFNPDGNEVRRVDDVTISDGKESWTVDAGFDFSSQHDGPHDLCIRDLAGDGGPAFAYRVEVTGNEPTLQLRAEVAGVALPRENYQPVALKVTRTRFTGPVELELLGAPAGVVLEPTTIPADVSEIVCRLKADSSAPEGLATLQIVGRWQSVDPNSEMTATAAARATTLPLIDQRIKDKDLRESALREDQLRPPPSLTNRLALLITPPAPFDLQLPEATLLITKYVEGEFPIVTTRAAGFASSISFTARGGQIGPEAEERSNVFLRFPTATPDELNVSGLVFNRILTQYGKFRVDVSATANDDARRVTLNRTFELDLKPAFSPAPEPASAEIEPGGTAICRLLANRTPAFDGVVTLTPTPLSGFQFPEKIEIPAGQSHVDIEVKAAAETAPGSYQLRMTTRGFVGKYEEEVNGPNLSITIKKPLVEKKP
ncbi:MAG: hypothetical protein O3C40_22880 [Planctomycetota bacterium]|nr:hypothetical protein [Planctomycetota bacterium]